MSTRRSIAKPAHPTSVPVRPAPLRSDLSTKKKRNLVPPRRTADVSAAKTPMPTLGPVYTASPQESEAFSEPDLPGPVGWVHITSPQEREAFPKFGPPAAVGGETVAKTVPTEPEVLQTRTHAKAMPTWEYSEGVENRGPLLSHELNDRAPLGANAGDRVFLWIKQNKALIKDAASRYQIPAEAIAGMIAWEAIENRSKLGIPSIRGGGVGKVHTTDSLFDAVKPWSDRGEGVARDVEDIVAAGNSSNRYITPRSIDERKAALTDKDQGVATSIEYMAAIMGQYASIAERHGLVKVRGDAVLLANFYNGGMQYQGKPVRFDSSADRYFEGKALSHGEFDVQERAPLSVFRNMRFLTDALQ